MAVSGPASYKHQIITAHLDAISNSATSAYLVGSATGGPTLPGGQGGRLHKLSADGNVGTAEASTDVVITVYKGAMNAANEALVVTLDLDSSGDVQGTSTTVVDSGMDVFGASDELVIRATSSGTTYALADLNIALEFAVAY